VKIGVSRLLVDTKQSYSFAEARRYIQSKIVKFNDNFVDEEQEIELKPGDILQVGKNREKVEFTEDLINQIKLKYPRE